MVELPPNDEKPRLRVALVPEAEQLLAALTPEDRVPYALACYAGLRRSEIHRLEWPEVLDDGKIASHLLVLRSKSEAGTQRRPPIAEPLQQILREAWLRQGRPTTGPVSRALGDVGQARERRDRGLGARRPEPDHAARVPPHLRVDADGRALHAQGAHGVHGPRDLQMVNRYVKLLPQPRDDNAADRLNDYLRRSRHELRPGAASTTTWRVALQPALDLGDRDEHELPAADDAHRRLHVALEVADAHPERRRGLLACQREPRDGLQRSARSGLRHPITCRHSCGGSCFSVGTRQHLRPASVAPRRSATICAGAVTFRCDHSAGGTSGIRDLPSQRGETWNDTEAINRHREMTPSERVALAIEASRAALLFAEAKHLR